MLVVVHEPAPAASSTRKPLLWLRLAACGTVMLWCFAACGGSYGPYQKPPHKPPYKPGDSIRKTKMCTCKACDPASCCRELEQERPELQDDCAQGYDFSQCELAVSSCESNCYQHKWRIQAGQTCVSKRPDACCHQND